MFIAGSKNTLIEALSEKVYCNIKDITVSSFSMLKSRIELSPYGLKFSNRLLLKVMGKNNLGNYLK